MAARIRISKEALNIGVVVRRRAKGGATPFGWEVYGADTAEPIHVCPDRFSNMEDAYKAGQARLMEFIPARTHSAEATVNSRWHSRTTTFAPAEPSAPSV